MDHTPSTARRAAAAAGVLLAALIATSAQAQTTATITVPIAPTALRIAWPAGVDNGIWTDEYVLAIDAARFSLAKPAAVPGVNGALTLPPTFNVEASAAAVAALTVGAHAVRILAKNAYGETASPTLTLTIVATAPPGPIDPRLPPAAPGPVTVTVTITVTH